MLSHYVRVKIIPHTAKKCPDFVGAQVLWIAGFVAVSGDPTGTQRGRGRRTFFGRGIRPKYAIERIEIPSLNPIIYGIIQKQMKSYEIIRNFRHKQEFGMILDDLLWKPMFFESPLFMRIICRRNLE